MLYFCKKNLILTGRFSLKATDVLSICHISIACLHLTELTDRGKKLPLCMWITCVNEYFSRIPTGAEITENSIFVALRR